MRQGPSTRSIGRSRSPPTGAEDSGPRRRREPSAVHATSVRTRRFPIHALSSSQAVRMGLIRLYARVLGQLGSDLRVGALLALANVALAISAFAEPILFGRIDRKSVV